MKKFKTYVTEVSTGKLLDYVAKASQDVGRRIEKAERGEKPFKKILNRSSKIGRAKAHIQMRMKEDVEQIDEISKELANRYLYSAFSDRKRTDDKMFALRDRQDTLGHKNHNKITKLLKKSDKRTTGIDRALTRLAKEETDQFDEGTVQDKIDKVAKIRMAHRALADKARHYTVRDKEAEAHHMQKSTKAMNLIQKMREKQSEANKSNPKPRPKAVDYGAAIAKDYKDQEAKRGIGHVRDHVELDSFKTIMELNRDTVYSYSQKADKEIEAKHRVLGPQIKAGNVAAANKTAHKITRRSFGLDRAVARLNKEEVESIEEAAKPHEIHVSPAKNGQYKVHAVGSKFAHGIKVGEHLNDTHLDDFSEMGGKVKMVKADKKKD